jgi:hypothetical protein
MARTPYSPLVETFMIEILSPLVQLGQNHRTAKRGIGQLTD